MGQWQKHKENHAQKSQGVDIFSADDHKAAWNRQDGIIKTNMEPN